MIRFVSRWSLLFFITFTTAVNAQIVRELEKPFADSRTILEGESPNFEHTDILHYDISLDLDVPLDEIHGSLRVTVKSLYEGLDKVVLNAHQLTIDSVQSRQGNHTFLAQDDLLEIPLITPLHQDDTLSISIFYHGEVQNDGFGGLFFEDPFIYTVGEGIYTSPPSMTRYWVPCKDVPWDKATLRLRLWVPEGKKAVATGKPEAPSRDDIPGKTQYQFFMEKPISTYLMAFAVADFDSGEIPIQSLYHDSLSFTFYVQPEFKTMASIDFQNIPEMMRIFEERFGPYPFNRYSMVVVPMRGAMEHQTMTSYSSYLLEADNRYDPVVAHELAHQWWGDWVTLRNWDEIWLNEGFASYSEVIYLEEVDTRENVQQYLYGKAISYIREANSLGYFSLAQPDYYWGSTVYEKGAWVLHMLRLQTGDDLFWQILKTYGQNHAYSNATIADFLEVVNQVTGDDYSQFFQEWVYGSGHPIISIEWAVEEKEEGAELFLHLSQTQAVENIFHFTFDLDIFTASDTLRKEIRMYREKQDTSFVLQDIPIAIYANQTQRVLAQFNFSKGIIPEKIILQQNYPNPFKTSESPSTTLEFITTEIESDLSVEIYNLLGKKISYWFFKRLPPGKHSFHWDGRDDKGSIVPSGVYYVILKTPRFTQKKKLTILR